MDEYKLLLELSSFDLEGRTRSIMGPERDRLANRVQTSNLIYIPMIDNNALKIGANNTSNNGGDYWSTMVFDRVIYGDEELPNAFTFKGSDNNDYFIERLAPNVNVKVNCSCLDFYYRFSVWNDRHRALDGKPPPPYVRLTQTRPEVNPMKTPGLCKHLIHMLDDLRNKRFFK